MKKKIIALLEARFPGMRKDTLIVLAGVIALQAEDETQATEIVGKLTADKVTSFQQEHRSDIDREIQQANQTLESNLRNKYDFTEKGKPKNEEKPQEQPGALTLDMIKGLFAEQLKPLSDRLDAVDAQKKAAARRETYMGKLKAAKLSQDLIDTMAGQFDRMSFKDDEDFEAYLTTTQPAIDKLAQQAADQANRRTPLPNVNKTNEQGVNTAVAAYVQQKQQQKQDSPLGGKAV